MSGFGNSRSNAHKLPAKIIGIQFSMLSPEEIRKNSVVQITSKDTYISNKPVIGGLFDPRMGVLEPGTVCPTDGLSYLDTPGYFGHIELARPVFFIQHMREILKICRCICYQCSHLLINKNQHMHALDMSSEDRWEYVSGIAAGVKRCGELTDDGCGCKQPDKIRLEGMTSIYVTWSKINTGDADSTVKEDIKLTPEFILKLFRRISDEDVAFMGFSPIWSHPAWMICQALPIPPPAVRPSVKHDAQQRSEDDLTHIYSNIIKYNNILLDCMASPDTLSRNIDAYTDTLQLMVAMIVNNNIKGAAPLAQRSGRPLQCIMGRINTKTGRIRGNLMGKRVDYSARSVITGDPNLSILQLGVPMKIAMNLTKPVVVNDRNRSFLSALVKNGPDIYPGAKILERKTGENITLRHFARSSDRLESGDIVHRHMMDGDAVLFNRQPSLHRCSMMCHIAKIMKKGDTFRMNVGDTKPYNADFDGDEMNLHMPQNVLAETELRLLAAVPYQIILPTNNKPVIGIYQDSLLGSYRLTRGGIEFSPRDAMNLLMSFNRVNAAELRRNIVGGSLTSFAVLSQIFPPMTMKRKIKDMFKDDIDDYATSNAVLEIQNGKYIRGQLNSGELASASSGILHRIFNDFGNMACANFNDDLQNIVTEYMKTASYSVGISDLMPDAKTQLEITKIITEKKEEVYRIIEKVHLGTFKNESAKSNIAEFESSINNTLNEANSQAGTAGRKSLRKDNRFLMIVESGSKGSTLNIAQMISCLGQQNVEGVRIPYGLNNRTLPHFSMFDDSPRARGFIENSYISGLVGPELFFHAMGGRVGLIDTAVKTATTGYIQRRTIKGLEDLVVAYDMTVRNSMGKIIQFKYGDDGFDPTKTEFQNVPLYGMSIEDVYMHYDIPGVNNEGAAHTASIYTKAAGIRANRQREKTAAVCKTHIERMLLERDMLADRVFKYTDNNRVCIPVAFQFIIANIQGQLRLDASVLVDITPLETFELVEEYLEKLNHMHYAKTNPLFDMLYRFYLSPRDLLVKRRFHRQAIILLLETVLLKFKEALIHPGECVGVVAGQAIGEPSTQLTLNSLVYESEIVVRDSAQRIFKVSIGDFTERHIALSKKIDYMQDKDTTYAELAEHFEVPCATEGGETVWRRVEAVTRHPVVNLDGTDTMLHVVTEGCREVIATKAKSFLQLREGKIVGVDGADLKVGDFLPCSRKPLEHAPVLVISARDILPPTEYIYGGELEKARLVHKEGHWWKKHAGKTFVLPHKRSDSVILLFGDNVAENRAPKKHIHIKPGNVYMKNTGVGMCDYEIPDEIALDYDFGYLCGAYAAGGCMTKHHISISNNDKAYFIPIERLCEKWNIAAKVYTHHNKNKEGWTSQDIRLYNTVLCRILENLCGKLSHLKFVSQKLVFSNRECILGFLDAHIGGDGVNQPKNMAGDSIPDRITITSVSQRMLIDVMAMLKSLGVAGHINKATKIETNNRGSKDIKQLYELNITNGQSQKLARMLNLPIAAKQEKLAKLIDREFKYEYSTKHRELPDIIDGVFTMTPRDGRMLDLEFDPIVSITEVPNSTPYAYDLTVEDTRNFDLYNGLCGRDTFHSSGISSKTNVTRGVPRIDEILRLTKNPKKPSLTVYLRSEEETEREKAHIYSNMLTHTCLGDIVESMQICFDPNDATTSVEVDRELLAQFQEFEDLMAECAEVTAGVEESKSKWVVRIEMNREAMLDKNITMDDVHFAIKDSANGQDINCVFSDYNASNLVFRLRLKSSVFNKSKKRGVAESLDQTDEIYMLKRFQDKLLKDIVLRGIYNVTSVSAREIPDNTAKIDSKYSKRKIWVLDTAGSNLLEVLGVSFIDYTRTTSTDIREVFDVLGIEAARQAIHDELVSVMEHSGVYINYHNTSILADRMTCKKDMVSMSKSGLLSDDTGTLAKASFEAHSKVLLQSAQHGNIDYMKGISASVFVGSTGFYGTSAFSITLDMKKMETLEDAEDVNVVDSQKEIELMFGRSENASDECSRKKVGISTNIAHIKAGEMESFDDDYSMGF